jgi:heptaprenyl diphosphate synthase
MIDFETALITSNGQVSTALNNLQGGLGEITSYLAQSIGKGVRTHVLLNASADADGLIPESAPKAAAAVELLHMATLVHDDVIDDAATRRGAAAVHRRFGQKNAILAGDYLLCLSLSMLTGIELPEDGGQVTMAARFASTVTKIVKGEFSQHLHNSDLNLSVFDYLKIISGKTAALFYMAAYAGAYLGRESETNCRALGRYGRCLGVMFQVADDCKDYEWSELEARKPVGNDIKSGVITLPLIMAMKKEPRLRDAALEAMRAEKEIPALLAAVRKAGGADAARIIGGRYKKWAEDALVGLSGIKKEKLTALLLRV